MTEVAVKCDAVMDKKRSQQHVGGKVSSSNPNSQRRIVSAQQQDFWRHISTPQIPSVSTARILRQSFQREKEESRGGDSHRKRPAAIRSESDLSDESRELLTQEMDDDTLPINDTCESETSATNLRVIEYTEQYTQVAKVLLASLL